MNKQKTLELSVSDIWEVMINPIRSDESGDGLPTISGVYNTNKPNEYQTQDYDTIYRNTFTKILENFGAEHEKRGNKRILIFDPKKLTRVAKQYGFVLDMNTETGVDGNVSKLLYIAVRAVLPYTPKNDENLSKDAPTNKDNIDSSQENNDNNSLYGSTACTAPGGGVYAVQQQQQPNNPDLSLAKTTECLKNHQKAYRARISKSKVAQAAEDNTSGKGVMNSRGSVTA